MAVAAVLAGVTLALVKVAAAVGTRAAEALPLALAAARRRQKKEKEAPEGKIVEQSTTWLRWASGGVGQGPTPRQKDERHEALRF